MRSSRDLAFVRSGAARSSACARPARVRAPTGRAARCSRLADASARGAGLDGALKRVEPVGAAACGSVSKSRTSMRWCAGSRSLSRNYGIEGSDLSADRADGIGLVNARVSLQDAPP